MCADSSNEIDAENPRPRVTAKKKGRRRTMIFPYLFQILARVTPVVRQIFTFVRYRLVVDLKENKTHAHTRDVQTQIRYKNVNTRNIGSADPKTLPRPVDHVNAPSDKRVILARRVVFLD